MNEPTTRKAKRYCCAYCGKDMGEWDSRYCSSTDTCGERECERWGQNERGAEREEAHERLDRDMGW